METQNNYRFFLKQKLSQARSTNPVLSLRAMALKMGLTASMLSQVLNGKKNLSKESALRIANILDFSHSEKDRFTMMVEIETAKSIELKSSLINKMNEYHPEYKAKDLSLELFRLVSDWYHFAILELTQVSGFEFNSKNIAKELNISIYDADLAIERLLSLDLIEKRKDGKYVKVENYILAHADFPNSALRSYHKQLLLKSIESLETQTPQEKIIGSETFAFAEEDLERARKLTEDFFAQMISLGEKSKKKKKHVYHFALQFFKLNKGAYDEKK